MEAHLENKILEKIDDLISVFDELKKTTLNI